MIPISVEKFTRLAADGICDNSLKSLSARALQSFAQVNRVSVNANDVKYAQGVLERLGYDEEIKAQRRFRFSVAGGVTAVLLVVILIVV